jgi:hypothetical protein
MSDTERSGSDGPLPTDPDSAVQERRQAMLRFAAYTAPVMLAMLTSENAMAASTSSGPLSPPPTY